MRKGMKSRPMRGVLCTLVTVGLASPALAADYDVLRGPQPDTVLAPAPVLPVAPATFTRWSGVYVGGQFSYGNATTDFSGATAPLISFSLRDTTLETEVSPSQYQVLGRTSEAAPGFGGFLGYNTQWQDLIVGIEGNYTRTSFTTTSSVSAIGPPASPSRVVAAGGTTYNINLSGTGNLDLTDYASLRGRAGIVVGNVLPYGFVGFVVGQGSYHVTSLIFGQTNSASPPAFPCDDNGSTCTSFSAANSAGQNSALMYGFSLGGGVDWALTPNFFLRGEFEFIQFAPIANINVDIIGARVGAGFKF
jgi:outer membrane immunogenic protein